MYSKFGLSASFSGYRLLSFPPGPALASRLEALFPARLREPFFASPLPRSHGRDTCVRSRSAIFVSFKAADVLIGRPSLALSFPLGSTRLVDADVSNQWLARFGLARLADSWNGPGHGNRAEGKWSADARDSTVDAVVVDV